MTIIGAILVVIALNTNPGQRLVERQHQKLAAYGKELIRIHEEMGHDSLIGAINRFYKEEGIRLVLVDAKTNLLSAQPEQPYLMDFTRRALLGKLGLSLRADQDQPGSKAFNTFSIPLGGDYVLLAEVPKPSKQQILLDPHALTLRLLVTFLVAGIICYLVTRSITAPIMKLREATQKIAGGNLATRVSPSFGREKGELAELANDFDTMAERIEDLLQSRQRLLRDISHELRSPLARLNVALELARKQIGENIAPLARIEKESDRLNILIGQILSITKLESRTEIKDKETVDLADLLAKIVDDANYECLVSDQKVRLKFAEVATIRGSQELLYRAIENIVRNAIHYTAKGSVVDIVMTGFNDGTWARIEVHDRGPGVPDEALAELFRPFYRVSESRDRDSGGTGVGLAIAEQAIKIHGGRISAENHPEGGLLLTILLPLDGES